MKLTLKTHQVVTINRMMSAVGTMAKVGGREVFKTKIGDARARRRLRKAFHIDWDERDLSTANEVYLDAFSSDEELANDVHTLWLASQQGERISGEQMRGLRDALLVGRNAAREYEIEEGDAKWLLRHLAAEEIESAVADDCLDIADILDNAQPAA